VKEINNGTSNATFDWMVIAKRRLDAENNADETENSGGGPAPAETPPAPAEETPPPVETQIETPPAEEPAPSEPSETPTTELTCTTADCSSTATYTFTKPSEARYEAMTEADFYISYNWSAYGLTIGEGMVNFSNDNGAQKIIWQNYSHSNSDGKVWMNYSIDSVDQSRFTNETRNINLRS